MGEGDHKYGMGEAKEEPWGVGVELEIAAWLDAQYKDLLSKRKEKKIRVKKEGGIRTSLLYSPIFSFILNDSKFYNAITWRIYVTRSGTHTEAIVSIDTATSHLWETL